MTCTVETQKNNSMIRCYFRFDHKLSDMQQSQTYMLTWLVERRCVSNESCLCSSGQYGFASVALSSRPNHHPHNEPHNSQSCQSSPSPSWPPLRCAHCLNYRRIANDRKIIHSQSKCAHVYAGIVSCSLPLCVVIRCLWMVLEVSVLYVRGICQRYLYKKQNIFGSPSGSTDVYFN